MKSLILRTTVRFLLPLLLVFSAFLFLRGHNEPGGGFAAGLVAAAAFALYAIAYGVPAAREVMRLEPRLLISFGLLAALVSGLPGMLGGQPCLACLWALPPILETLRIELGTPLLFDLGVFLVVVGATTGIVFMLQEAE
jgi:multicomponent Na+:H+ antiporter subunit B